MGLDDLLNRARSALDDKEAGEGDSSKRPVPEARRRPADGRITEYGTIPPEVVETAVADLQDNPDDAEAEAYLAFLHYAGKRYQIALEHFDRLLAGGFKPAHQQFYRGNCLFQLGDRVGAREAWNAALAANPPENIARMVEKRLGWLEEA